MASLMCVCVLLFNSTSQVTSRRRSTEYFIVSIYSPMQFSIYPNTQLCFRYFKRCVCVFHANLHLFTESPFTVLFYNFFMCTKIFSAYSYQFHFFFHFVHFFTFIRSFQFFSFYLHALIVFFLLLLYFSASTTHRSSN